MTVTDHGSSVTAGGVSAFGQPYPATPREARKILCDALDGQLPDWFRWDFNILRRDQPCGTVGCALGLAQILFKCPYIDLETAVEVFDLTQARAEKIFEFSYCGYEDAATVNDVTPEMVAGKLRSAPYRSARKRRSPAAKPIRQDAGGVTDGQ